MEAIGNILYDRVLPPLLKQVVCIRCGSRGEIQLVRNPNNNGIALHCACGSRQPISGLDPFLPQNDGSKRRRNAIAALHKAGAERRCYVCGLVEEQLNQLGRGLHAHHTVPDDDTGPQIPLCTLCHEIARALQHAAGRYLQIDAEAS